MSKKWDGGQMTDDQLRLFELTFMLVGVVVGFFGGAPVWGAITTYIIARSEESCEDEEMK